MDSLSWENIGKQKSQSYTCGYCGFPLSSEMGWMGRRYLHGANQVRGAIYVCHRCERPTFFDLDTSRQVPGVSFGNTVKHITDASVREIYEEARRATSAGCYTSAVLCCRKLLMHMAVAKGAKPGDSFKSYVEFLAKNNHIPADCKDWVDEIRDTGNEANHEVVIMKQADAETLVSFCEMLLKIFFEFPATARARSTPKSTAVTASK